MQTAGSFTLGSASCAENWHPDALPGAFTAFVDSLGQAFSRPGTLGWRASAQAAQAAVGEHIGNPELLDGMRYVMRCSGYSRVLLHADPEGRFSVLGLVWPPGCITPIHAHLAWCALGVHNGTLVEETFSAWQDGETSPGALVSSRALVPGDTCCDASEGRFVHRLSNRSQGFAMSLHVYGVPSERIGDAVNRILST